MSNPVVLLGQNDLSLMVLFPYLETCPELAAMPALFCKDSWLGSLNESKLEGGIVDYLNVRYYDLTEVEDLFYVRPCNTQGLVMDLRVICTDTSGAFDPSFSHTCFIETLDLEELEPTASGKYEYSLFALVGGFPSELRISFRA